MLPGVDGGDGHVDVGRGGIGLGAGQRSLRVLDGDLVVARIELGDRVARLDQLVLFHIDLDDLAGDARADLDQMAVDLRVVSIFAEGGVPPDPDGDQHQDHDHNHDDAPAAGLRLRRSLFLDRLGRSDWCWSCIRHVYFPPKYFL